MKTDKILEIAKKHMPLDNANAIVSFANELLQVVENRSVWVLLVKSGQTESVKRYYNDLPKLESMLLDESLEDYTGKEIRELHSKREVKLSKGFNGSTLKLVRLKNHDNDNIVAEEYYHNYSSAKGNLINIFGLPSSGWIDEALKHVSFPMSQSEMDKAEKFVESKVRD